MVTPIDSQRYKTIVDPVSLVPGTGPVQVVNETNLGDPYGVNPLRVIQHETMDVNVITGGGGFTPKRLAECRVDKNTVNVNSNGVFATKFMVKNNCVEGIDLPLVSVFTDHGLAGDNLKVRFILYASIAAYNLMDSWGYCDMITNASSGKRFSYMGPCTPAVPLQDANATDRLEGMAWEVAEVQLAWQTGGSTYNVNIAILANFNIEEYVP